MDHLVYQLRKRKREREREGRERERERRNNTHNLWLAVPVKHSRAYLPIPDKANTAYRLRLQFSLKEGVGNEALGKNVKRETGQF